MNVQSSLFKEVAIDTIKKIFQNLLQEDQVWEAQLLDGGMFNTTYLVVYGSKHESGFAVRSSKSSSNYGV